jgi:redox-sensitive bicupin YhaK (pirin superfamily)
MDLAPHPHIGLQTVSWLLEGEIVHRDSLGCESLLHPGAINLMTAGYGIAHSEETPRRMSGRLSGVQLWIAQPDASRHCPPAFEHRPTFPLAEPGGGRITAILKEESLIGADAEVWAREKIEVPLEPRFEHALLVLEGTAEAVGRPLDPDVLYYLGTGRANIPISSRKGARLLLIGGIPFGETILMWWNFVARTQEEIVEAAQAWMRGERFGQVPGAGGPPMPAPPLRGRAKPPAAS